MSEEKVKLIYKKPENKELEYNGTKFVLRPYLSIPEQVFLIKRYIEDYFGDFESLLPESPYNLFEAEYNQINYILQILTNVDPGEGFVDEFYSDDIFLDSLMEKIVNYLHFRDRLDRVVSEIKEAIALENSLGAVITNVVEKLSGILEKFSEITPEQIEGLQEKGSALLKELQESSIIQDASKKEK